VPIAACVAAVLVLAGGAAWYRATRSPPASDGHEEAAIKPGSNAEPKQQRPSSAAGVRGSMVVKTEPAGATIQVGDALPAKSPAAFQDIPPGKYAVEISLDGYDPLTVEAVVKENQIADLGSVKLQRSKGALHVASSPSGLAYDLRSKANPLLSTRGETPLDATDMPVGDYEITVSREGWPAQKQTVTVAHEQEQRTLFEFVGGSLVITSEPPGAKVQAAGKDLGVTPLRLGELPPGDLEYAFDLPGYTPATLKATIQPREQASLNAVLNKLAAKPVANKTRTAGTTKRKANNDDGESHSSSHSHTGEILRGIFGGGFHPGFGPPRPF
jgi:hypothetical protein